jgi:TonB family protein
MNKADVGTDISVKVQYIPDNTLKHNDVKEMTFSFVVDPESEATFYGGEQQLKKYLKEHGLEKISPANIKRYHLAAVKFTINEEGQVINAHVFESSKDEKVDKLLLDTISKMPRWKPAEYANGTKVKQEFVLLVGDMESCVINLVNIRRN